MPPSTSPASPINKPYTASTREIWSWGIGAIACHLMIQIYGQANIIFTVGFALSPVIVSWCMMLPRVVDGVVDPFIGHLSDQTNTRWGRRKPFLAFGSVMGAIFLMALWWADPAWAHTSQFIYLFVFGTLFYISYGIYTMAWSAMGYELTDDYNERSKVAAISGFFLAAVTLAAQWTYPIALKPLFQNGVLATGQALWTAGFDFGQIGSILSEAFTSRPGTPTNEINGMRWISALAAGLVLISAFVAIYFCKERFTHVNREHVPMLPALKTTVKNRPFMILIGFKICQILGERAALGLLIYLAIYLVCGGDKASATKITALGATVGTVLGLGVLVALKPITRAIGKRNAQICSAGITFAAALALPFILQSGIDNLLIIPAMIAIPLGTLNSTLTSAMVPDICDVDELDNGYRREGLFTAVMGFVSKMEISLCFLLVGYILSWSGFDAKLPVQPGDVLQKLFWLCVIPNILFTFIGLILTIRFPVTPAAMEIVRQQLDERRLAQAAAGIPTDAVAEEVVAEHPEIVAEIRKSQPPNHG